MTEHWTDGGKLWLCALKNVWSNRIVGYSIDSRMKSRRAVAALDSAVSRRRIDGRDVVGCILHSDRGSKFRSDIERLPFQPADDRQSPGCDIGRYPH
jgi:transposase InsO family protein